MESIKKDKNREINSNYLINKQSEFVVIEAYNTARMNLLTLISKGSNNIVNFSSCTQNEGKSTICINLAITLAKSGYKLLLIDTDMRKPMINRLLNISHTTGLSTILDKLSDSNESIIKDVIPNIDILISGPIPPNPSELLASSQMKKLIDKVKENYDIILVDTPPVNMVGGMMLINKYTAGTVLVVREDYTSHKDLAKAIDTIKRNDGNIIGFIKVCNKNKRYIAKRTYI